MEFNKASVVYFSPTDSTKNVALQVLAGFEMPTEVVDLTAHSNVLEKENYAYDEVAIFATAVHGGRVPTVFMNKLQSISGRNTPVVLIVTYGNRDYEDALLEMKDFVEKRGFIVIGAAAVIAEHSIMRSVATDRPNLDDVVEINNFTNQLLFKIEQGDDIVDMDVEVPGNFPYRIYSGVPLKPKASRKCDKCGECATLCPVEAISVANPSKTDKDTCISCLRCVKVCKNSARQLNRIVLGGLEKTFIVKYSAPRDAEFFL